jgi:hypothetical protein
MPSFFDIAAGLLNSAAKLSSLRPSVLPEIVAFAAGVKPSLRLVFEPEEEAVFMLEASRLGLSVAIKSVYLESKGGSWFSLVDHETDRKRALVVIAQGDLARELLHAETCDAEQAGKLLGYPACCVKAFPQLAEKGGLWGRALATTAQDMQSIDARCNRYAAEWGGIGLLGELFPCSLECDAAKNYADRLYQSMVRLGLHRLAERAKSDSLMPVTLSDDGIVNAVSPETAGCLRFEWKTKIH